MKAEIRIFGVFSWFLLLSPVLIAAPLKLGIHPYLPATELVERFTPLTMYLAEQLGEEVEIEISGSYEEHGERVGSDRYDLAYVGPATFVHVTTDFGKKPILARMVVGGKSTFRGALVVAEKSSVHSITDLVGRRFAFGNVRSTMSYVVPRFVLEEAGVTVDRLSSYQFLDNHHDVVLGVLLGDFDAGAVKEEVFEEYHVRGLRLLAWTDEIPEHVFVACGDLPTARIEALRAALLSLSDKGTKGLEILQSIKLTATDLEEADDSDYDGLRRILDALGPLEDLR